MLEDKQQEKERLAALHSLNILDTPSEERFDRITRLAAHIFDVKHAFITLIDEHRQWFKSAYNFPQRETSREASICALAIEKDQPLVIEDTLKNTEISSSPLVVSAPFIRFYAGIPIKIDDKFNIGTLCIIDTKPRHFSDKDICLLIDLAKIAQSEIVRLELTQLNKQLVASKKKLKINKKLNNLRNRALEQIATAIPLSKTLNLIVKSISHDYPEAMPSILLLSDDGRQLFHAASDRLPKFYDEAVDGVEIGPETGSCGAAAHSGKRVIVENISTHPYWADFKELAAQANLGSCWSEPIISANNKVLGTFAIYHQYPKAPDSYDCLLIEQSAHLASIAIERENTNKLVWQQANYDSLTKLPNRTMMRENLKQAISHAKRYQKKLAVIFLDLDHFKDVNDTLGHAIGDALLIETANRLASSVRDYDIVARLGGDEFVIILNDISNPSDAEHVIQLLQQKLSEPFHLNEEVVYCTASIGITIYPDDNRDIDSLLKNADQAMYSAKSHGRNTYHYFTQSLREAAHNRMQLINDLRTAINENQFHLAFQPIIDLKTDKVYKAEALIRWQHPEQGFISPLDFIPVAEDTGLIIELSNWIFGEATQLVKKWRKKFCPGLQISINTSPVQYKSGESNILSWISKMTELQLHPEAIAIEITENLLMESKSEVSDKLATFRQAGIAISIDDFGTGYSSFSYLKSFTTDFIKIDKSFVQKMHKDSEDMVLCEAIIMMAKRLNIKVIAEGIETQEQESLLKAIGCDYGQGYHFAKPLDKKAFTEYLNNATMNSKI